MSITNPIRSLQLLRLTDWPTGWCVHTEDTLCRPHSHLKLRMVVSVCVWVVMYCMCLYIRSVWPDLVRVNIAVCGCVFCRWWHTSEWFSHSSQSRWQVCRQMLYQFYVKAALNGHHDYFWCHCVEEEKQKQGSHTAIYRRSESGGQLKVCNPTSPIIW